MSNEATQEAGKAADTETSARADSRTKTYLLVGTLLLVGFRYYSEQSLMDEYGPDAQMGIWKAIMLGQLAFWLSTGLVAVYLITASRRERSFFFGALGLWTVWCVAISWSGLQFNPYHQALKDARNPSTSPARLQDLVEYQGFQAGYELDNRIAANPNCSPETMHQLYDRHNMGTIMILARSPRTPPDILVSIAERDIRDTWILRSLGENPNLPEDAQQKLRLARQK